MTLVVGTAGHIDHGKTTLLRVLTGIDADRLPEERRRGMTIDVGYAHLTLDDGRTIDFVDVPGHDRLVGNMLVGTGEIDAVLLVVAADDGPRAQTREHLGLVDALGIGDGIVAITKSDVVPPERLAEVERSVRELLAPTGLAGAPVLAVSALGGAGIGELRAAIVGLADRMAGRDARGSAGGRAGPARLAIDRVFSIRGRGTVVTGTLRGGPMARGDRLVVEPGGLAVRVREVQVRGSVVASSDGGRTALNLGGVETRELRRGQVVGVPGAVAPSDRLLVTLERGAPPADRARLRLHLGTDQAEARVGRSGRESVRLPGDAGVTALLRLDRPVAAATGDRFVLRRPAPGGAVTGGRILDPSPPTGASRRRATPERLAALARAVAARAVGGADGAADPGHPGVHAAAAVARLDLHGGLLAAPRPSLAPDVVVALGAAALEAVREPSPGEAPATPLAGLRAALARELRRQVSLPGEAAVIAAAGVIDDLVAAGVLARAGDRVVLPGARAAAPSADAAAAMDRLVAALDVPAPPPLSDAARAAGCPPSAVRSLERDGRIVVPAPDLAWSRDAWERLARLALDLATREPLTPATLRDASGTSRKYVMALLEDLDRRGILARAPAGHVPGPRAGQLRAGSAT